MLGEQKETERGRRKDHENLVELRTGVQVRSEPALYLSTRLSILKKWTGGVSEDKEKERVNEMVEKG